MNDDRLYLRQQAINSQLQGIQQRYGYVEKDPTVASANDAVAALRKRAAELRGDLAKVDAWTSELERIEKMLAADGAMP